MTNFIPIFPLELVVFPGEHLNLHIFEPRYKQLINDCQASGKPFGIPPVINGKMNDVGTLMKITEITKLYDNGEMDIKTEGLEVFRVLEIIKSTPEKLYSGAIVHYPENNFETGRADLMASILQTVRQLHRIIKLNKDFKKADKDLISYDIAHHAALSVEDEYILLSLMSELQRQLFLRQHLDKVMGVMRETALLKKKIMANGHFKNPSSLDL